MSPRKRRSGVLDADASIEEVEAAAEDAQARALTARAHAETLRRRVAEFDDRSLTRWLPSAKLTGLVAAVAIICTALVFTVLMVLDHRNVVREQQRAAEYSAAARQSVVTMMTIDPANVEQNIKDVIANATGKFKSTLEAGEAESLIKGAQQSKVSTKATVQTVAIESMTERSAVVLVAATTEGTGPDNAKLPPATWRISLTLLRENGQLKTSEFQFVR